MTAAQATVIEKKAENAGVGVGNEEVAKNLPAPAPVPKAPLATGGKIAALVPADLEQAYRLASAIAASGMAPKSYKVDPRAENSPFDANKIMVGILHGMEVGFTPMAALQSIAVINGMPSIWGDGALALVEASGLLIEKKEWLEGEGDNMAAHCWMLRRGRKEPVYQIFSMAAAAKAGLKSKTGPWQQYPQRMLQMRARSWAMRDGFSDILRGLAIREEVLDMGDLRQMEDGTYTGSAPMPPAPTRAAITASVQADKQIAEDLSRGSDRMPDTEEERGEAPEGDTKAEAGTKSESGKSADGGAKPDLEWVTADGEIKKFDDPGVWMASAMNILRGALEAGESVDAPWQRNAKNWEAAQAAVPAGKVHQNGLARFKADLQKVFADAKARDEA